MVFFWSGKIVNMEKNMAALNSNKIIQGVVVGVVTLAAFEFMVKPLFNKLKGTS